MTARFVLALGGPGVVISDKALAAMDRFRQLRPNDKEAGGQLFATFDGGDTVIAEATGPKWLDRRSRHGFRPNRLLQQFEIRERYARALHFVGDWHTHPEAIPSPSFEDLRNMTDCYERSLHDLRAFIMLIVGTAPAPGGLHVALVDGSAVQTMIPDESST